VEDLATNFHTLGEGFSASGDDEELLEGKLVAGVFSSVDHIEAGDGKSLGNGVSSNISIMLPERNATMGGSSLSDGKGNFRVTAGKDKLD
jgi:hypothetical protein